MSRQRVVVGLELQVPYHNMKAFRAFIQFCKDFQPTRVVGIGDHLDCPAPSRWNRGTAAEYATNLQKEIDTLNGMLWELRDDYDGPLELHTGNHEKRIDVYTSTKAPAFSDLRCLSLPELLDYRSLGIADLPTVAKLAPGWVSTHGDIGTLSKYGGGTAISLARRFGESVVCGHTHRLGHIQESVGRGARQILHGVETGHMMDVGKASYITTGAPNWQSGWAALEIDGDRVHVHLVGCSPSGKVTYSGAH